MEILFLGHAGFLITTGEKNVAIDPFLTDNPLAIHQARDIRADYILITHGHGDHMNDAFEIANNYGGTIVGIAEIARYAQNKGIKNHSLNTRGSYDFGPFKAKLTPALHSSSLYGWPPIYMGLASGFMITAEGKNIYHAGDTALFSDMALIGKNKIDLAFLPIGDNFTMGPDDALEAVKLLTPRTVVPMHYNTWPIINQDAASFKEKAEKLGTQVVILNPGDIFNL